MNQSQSDEMFWEAVQHGNLDTLQSLVARGWGINRMRYGHNALYYAAIYHQDEIAQFLLDRGATMDLELAAMLGKTEVVRDGLEADPQGKAWDYPTRNEYLLLLAAQYGRTGVMRLLLERGENVNATNIHGDSPLILAVQGDHTEAVILLLEAGAEVNLIPYNGEAALLHVQSAAIAQRLLEHGANVNGGGSTFNIYSTNNRTPLMGASFYKDKELISLLLDWGAEVNARDGYGQTALIYAASHSPGSQVQILLEAGAGDNLQEDLDTALFSAVSVRTDCVEDLQFYHRVLIPPGTPDDPMLVCKAVEEELRKTIELLLNHGADIAARDHVRATALHMACRNVNLGCIQTLLRYHPDVNARDLKGETPLDYVRSKSKRPHASPFRVTPFQVQYRISQRRQIIPLLRQAGAKTSKELSPQSTTM